MKRTHLFIFLGLALAGLGTWQMLKSKPPAAEAERSEEHHDHGEEADEHGAERVQLTPEKLANAHLTMETAGPATIETLVSVTVRSRPTKRRSPGSCRGFPVSSKPLTSASAMS